MGQVYSDFADEYPSTWDNDDVREWKEKARLVHQTFYLAFQGRQWDIYKSDEYDLLRVKICFALFGNPQEENNNIEDIKEAYDDQQKESGNKIKNKILEVAGNSSSDLAVGIIFVYCKQGDKEFSVPVFRVRTRNENKMDYYSFVDTNLRVYQSWDDWKSNNLLPMVKYCYPTRGFYTCSQENSYKFDPDLKPDVEFGTSPACDLTSRIGRQLDFGTSAVSFASAAVGICALMTPLAPAVLLTSAVAGGTSAAYGAGRSVQRLVDKSTHGESITDLESLLCGLNILLSPLHLVTGGVNSFIAAGAKNGRVFTSTIRAGVTFLNCTTLTLDSAMMLMGMINLYEKYQSHQLTALDVLQFSISAFFFTHTLIQPKTASGIIRRSQNEHFTSYKNNMSDADAQAAFDKFVEQNNKSMRDGAKVVKTINRIQDPSSFFKAAGQENATIQLGGRSGKTVIINNEVRVNPNRFNQLAPEKAKLLMQVTKQYQSKQMDTKDFQKYVKDFWRDERISFEARRTEIVNNVAKVFGTDAEGLRKIKINGKEMFSDLDGKDIDRIGTVFGDTARNYNKDIIEAAISVSRHFDCENIHDVCTVVELIAIECKGKPKSEWMSYLKTLRTDQNVTSQFVNDVLQDSRKAEDILQNTTLKFKNPLTATYHYRKHGHEFGQNIQMSVYLDDIPKNLFKEEYLFRDVFDQDGVMRVRTFANPENFQFGVELLGENGKNVATVFTNKSFFQNWVEKLAAARENLQFCRVQYEQPLPSVESLFSVFVKFLATDMGFAGIEGQICKNNKKYNLNTFQGNEEDLDGLRRLAAALASLS